MRTICAAATKDKIRIVAAIDCDEITPATANALLTKLLARITEKNPVASKIAQTSSWEMFEYLLEGGWKFELMEQFNEARILETPQQENKDA